MDPDDEIEFDFSPFVILYKSGRVHRFGSTSRKSAGTDAATGVTSKDVVIDAGTGLAARLFLLKGVSGSSQKLPVLVYFHGGAFVVQSAFSPRHTGYVNALVAAARVVAVSVEYRLAPEHPVPAAYDDAWAALCWTAASCASGSAAPEPWLADHGDPTRIFVAGNSSGGNMAHNVVMRAGKEGLRGIEGMVLLHPLFRGKVPVPSEGADPAVAERSERNWRFVCAGKYGVDHPFSNPLAMPLEEWATLGCRRALVTTAELDPVRDRARRYVETLRGGAWGGKEAVLYETDGEDHLYYLLKDARFDPAVAEKAAKEMAAVVSFIRRGACTSVCDIRSAL